MIETIMMAATSNDHDHDTRPTSDTLPVALSPGPFRRDTNFRVTPVVHSLAGWQCTGSDDFISSAQCQRRTESLARSRDCCVLRVVMTDPDACHNIC
jgi:hypothetical protein